MAKFSVPREIHNIAVGLLPPSRLPKRSAAPAMTTAARVKRKPAEVNGGRKSRPARITTQVLPQRRHSSARRALIVRGEGRIAVDTTERRRECEIAVFCVPGRRCPAATSGLRRGAGVMARETDRSHALARRANQRAMPRAIAVGPHRARIPVASSGEPRASVVRPNVANATTEAAGCRFPAPSRSPRERTKLSEAILPRVCVRGIATKEKQCVQPHDSSGWPFR